jgi:hypothetical protein
MFAPRHSWPLGGILCHFSRNKALRMLPGCGQSIKIAMERAPSPRGGLVPGTSPGSALTDTTSLHPTPSTKSSGGPSNKFELSVRSQFFCPRLPWGPDLANSLKSETCSLECNSTRPSVWFGLTKFRTGAVCFVRIGALKAIRRLRQRSS